MCFSIGRVGDDAAAQTVTLRAVLYRKGRLWRSRAAICSVCITRPQLAHVMDRFGPLVTRSGPLKPRVVLAMIS